MSVVDIAIEELRAPDGGTPDMTLVTSIGEHGVLTPLIIKANGTVIDGRERLKAAKAAGLTTVPCRVVEGGEVLPEAVRHVAVKPLELSRQLARLILENPDMTRAEMAGRLGKSEEWITQKLSLLDLCPEIAAKVDDGSIGLLRAYGISKLPHEEQRKLC